MDQRQSRIVSNPAILAGKPTIEGTRMSVEFILDLFNSGLTVDEILSEYPHLTQADLQAVIDFAKDAVSRERLYRSPDKAATI